MQKVEEGEESALLQFIKVKIEDSDIAIPDSIEVPITVLFIKP